MGYEREVSEAAFVLSGDKELTEDVIKGAKGYYVIRFKERKPPEPDAFKKEKEKITERLLMQKEIQIFELMLAQAKDRSEILIEDHFLK